MFGRYVRKLPRLLSRPDVAGDDSLMVLYYGPDARHEIYIRHQFIVQHEYRHCRVALKHPASVHKKGPYAFNRPAPAIAYQSKDIVRVLLEEVQHARHDLMFAGKMLVKGGIRHAELPRYTLYRQSMKAVPVDQIHRGIKYVFLSGCEFFHNSLYCRMKY